MAIQLNENDINYFTSDLNLPGILTFVDLKSLEPKVYWAEIIPKHISKNNSVEIEEKNLISKDTVLIHPKKLIHNCLQNYFRKFLILTL